MKNTRNSAPNPNPLGIALIAAIALAITVPAALAGTESRTYANRVSLVFRSVPAGDSFHGRVRSEKPACRRGRKIVIFRKRSGGDERIRAARTRRGGRWEAIPSGGRAGSGTYYLVLRRKVLRGGASPRDCAPVTTGTIRITRR